MSNYIPRGVSINSDAVLTTEINIRSASDESEEFGEYEYKDEVEI